MQPTHGSNAYRLAPWLVAAGVLAGGGVGAWLGTWHGPAAAHAFAEQEAAKHPKLIAQGVRSSPVVAVVTRQPGLSPLAMEREITNRLEAALRNAEGLRTIESSTTTGLSIVWLHFDATVSPALALAQAAGLAGTIAPQLPPGTPAPEVRVVDPARPLPACLLVLDHANLPLLQQAELARQQILPELLSVAGITAWVGPAPERVIAITLSHVQMQARKLSVQGLPAALEAGGAPSPSGFIRVGNRQLLLTSPPPTLSDLKNCPIGSAVVPTFLSQVADLADATEPSTALAQLDDRRCVWVAVHGKSGTSDAAAREAVRKAMPQMQGRLPAGVKLALLTFGDPMNPEAGVLTLHVQAAGGTSLEACAKRITAVEQNLKEAIGAANIRFMLAHVGPDATGSLAWPLRAGPHQATIRVQLTQPAQARELVKKLRPLLHKRFPELRIRVHAGSGTRWPAVVRVGGGTELQREKLARQVVARLAQLPAATDVETGERLPALRVDVDRAKAAAYGLTPADVQRIILAECAGLPCRVHVAPAGAASGARLRVVLRPPEREFRSVDDLSTIPITSPKQLTPLPLQNVANITTVDAPAEIEHQALRRVVTVRLNTDAVDSGPLAKAMEDRLKDLALPAGMWLKVHASP